MISGRLDRRITLQSRVETQTATGEVQWSWADVAEVWAAVDDVSVRDFFAASQMQVPASTVIRIRYRTGVTEKMRVKHIREHGASPRIDYYDIVGVMDGHGRDRELRLMCRRKSAEGFAYDGNA